jgi:hypothetical protein
MSARKRTLGRVEASPLLPLHSQLLSLEVAGEEEAGVVPAVLSAVRIGSL